MQTCRWCKRTIPDDEARITEWAVLCEECADKLTPGQCCECHKELDEFGACLPVKVGVTAGGDEIVKLVCPDCYKRIML